MGHRVAVLKDGLLQQVDTPRVLYSAPKNRFVAGFIGSPAMNLVEVTRTDGELRFGNSIVPLPDAAAAAMREQSDATFSFGVRPEHLRFVDSGISGVVSVVEELGSEAFVHARVEHDGESQLIVVRQDGTSTVGRGDNVSIEIAGPVHLFGSDGERLGD